MHTRTVILLSFLFSLFSASPVLTKNADKDVTEDLYKGKVKLADVTLKGEQTWQSDSGDQRVFAYYGYKYGKAGRFEHSVANTDFSYLENPDRVKQGHVCHQLPFRLPALENNQIFARNLSMHEDCLYLDVYVPPVKKDQEKTWPVLFWIHGGAFKIGDKDMYNGTILARAIDAVIVTVNYRLGAFGFLSTGDEAARGNWAIGDLKLALNWTVANIAKFGGDPSKITILGESAGGVLTSALMLDDHVRRQVHAAVAMSGSIVGSWATRADPGSGAKKVAASFGCSTENTAGIVECLKTQPVDAIQNASLHLLEGGAVGAVMYYTPVIDNLHIPKHPRQILNERVPAPDSTDIFGTFISGYMADDAAFFLITQPQLLNATFNYTLVSKLVMGPMAAEHKDCPQNVPVKVKLILDQYNLTESSSPRELRKGFYKISTDMMFGLSTMAESILYASKGGNNQMYLVSYDPDFMELGAFHFLEVLHMFRGPLDVLLKEKMSDSMTKSLYDYFRHVAHTGRASGSCFGADGNYQELNQQTEWVNQKQNFGPLLEFWQKLSALPCPPVAPN